MVLSQGLPWISKGMVQDRLKPLFRNRLRQFRKTLFHNFTGKKWLCHLRRLSKANSFHREKVYPLGRISALRFNVCRSRVKVIKHVEIQTSPTIIRSSGRNRAYASFYFEWRHKFIINKLWRRLSRKCKLYIMSLVGKLSELMHHNKYNTCKI